MPTAHSPCTRVSHTAQVEPEAAAVELVVEVVPGGGADARDDTDPQRCAATAGGAGWRRTDRSATSRRTTWSRACDSSPSVNRGSMPAIFSPSRPVGRVEVEVAEDAHLHAVRELEPAALEQRREVALHRGEQRHVEHRPAVLAVFDEREVGVRPAVAQPVDLAPHPHTVGEAAAHLVVDRLGQLADRVRRVRRVVVRLVAEVEGGLAHGASLPDGCDTHLPKLRPW